MRIFQIVLLGMVAALNVGCGSFPAKDHKHAVCHKGKTIYVDEAAIDAHIRHGDYGRACYGEKQEHKHGKDD